LPDAASSDVIRVSIKELESGGRVQNVQLQDGDTIFVPQAAFVYVFGQVRNPGSYPIQRDTTVLQALSLAGGVNETGAMNRIKIVRIVDGQKKEIKVKPGDFVKGGDTIIVPERFF
jgi:polysaccharide export outer membrane protein